MEMGWLGRGVSDDIGAETQGLNTYMVVDGVIGVNDNRVQGTVTEIGWVGGWGGVKDDRWGKALLLGLGG